MRILNEQEENFILSHKDVGKIKEKIIWAGIVVLALAQVATDVLSAFSRFKFTDMQTLAVKNSIFWIFILIFLVVIKNRQKKYLRIIKKLKNAIVADDGEGKDE